MSWEYSANPLRFDLRYRPGLDELLDALQSGRDVTPFLSTRIKIGYEVRPNQNLAARRDLDLLLNDWGVHHLHLSLTASATSADLNARTEHVLLVLVGRAQVFLLDIFPHHQWSDENIAHIMINNWPNSNFVRRVHQITGMRSMSNEDRAKLRGAGINTGLIEHKGQIWHVGHGGLTSAGTSIKHQRMALALMRGLRSFASRIDKVEIKSQIRNALGVEIGEPRFSFFRRSDDWYAIREVSTGALFDIDGIPRNQP